MNGAAAEPYTTRFETAVTAVDGRTVTLEQTYFYAESGGQPADRGRIGSIPVEDVQVVHGEHVHLLESTPRFGAGHRAMCAIDWTFRMYCMRAHTASHVLYGAAQRLLEEPAYAGFDIGDRTVRVDLETTTEIDDALLVELEALVNRQVWESQPVSWEQIPLEAARKREDIVFNVNEAFTAGKTASAGGGGGECGGEGESETKRENQDTVEPTDRIRIVTIGEEPRPWDVAACGGTHVRNTREIGPVTLLERSNPGAGRTRIEFAVGPEGIDRRAAEKTATYAAQQHLGVTIEGVPAALETVLAERDRLESEVTTLQTERVRRRLEGAEPRERAGSRWLVDTVDGVELAVLKEVAQAVVSERTTVDAVALIGKTEYTFAVVCVRGGREPAATDLSASETVDELVAAFGGGGGGSKELAQGGGFDATPEAVRDWFHSA